MLASTLRRFVALLLLVSFSTLTTSAQQTGEREKFIEDFWRSRDRDPDTEAW